MKNKNLIIKQTENYVRKELMGEGSGHDWWHIYRVWKMAQDIGKREKSDMFIVELAALLHDVADYKLHGGDENIGPKMAEKWLKSLKVEQSVIDQIKEIILGASFKGAKVKTQMKTIEGKIVQDADRLDAIGAVGIARTFAFGGYMQREIYNPNVKPQIHKTFQDYKNGKSHTINHFYEKLLLLKNLMNTKTAKQMAEKRHEYMEDFLKKFYKEWEGKE
jgi:uncharacterized protein